MFFLWQLPITTFYRDAISQVQGHGLHGSTACEHQQVLIIYLETQCIGILRTTVHVSYLKIAEQIRI